MENEIKDVKQEQPQAQESTKTEETSNDSEVVKTQEDKIDRNVYEKVRDAMKAEREAKRAAEARAAELEERIAKLEQSKPTNDDYTEDYDPYKAKTDILFLMNKDPFVKDNLDLIEQKMTENPRMDVNSAIREVKSEMFDRIQKEVTTVESNKPLKQEKTTAIQEETKQPLTGNILEDALAGRLENVPPGQLEALKRVLKR